MKCDRVALQRDPQLLSGARIDINPNDRENHVGLGLPAFWFRRFLARPLRWRDLYVFDSLAITENGEN